jgi:predicted enzyme related to lactoylglutathione lyase
MSSPIEPRLPTVFIHVTNMKRAVKFYSHLLGLPIHAGTDYANGIFGFHLENGADILLDANHAEAQQPSSAFHMHATCMFATGDIDASYRFMQENDVEVVTEIFRDPNVEFFNFKDPDGNIQMVCRSKK